MSLNVGVMTSRSGPVLSAALEGTRGLNITRIPGPSDLPGYVAGLDVLIVSNDLYERSVADALATAPRVQWLQIVSSGYDNVALHGVPEHLLVTRGGPNHARAVAEHAVMLLLALVRRLPEYERNRVAHRWDRQGLRFRMGSLEAGTALIVGFGAIGREIARRLRSFEMQIIGVMRHKPDEETAALADRIIAPEALHATLPHADAVILSLPLSPKTSRLMGRVEFAAMKSSAYLVNIARGGIVDHEALLEAVKIGEIAGAGLDVFDEEPLSASSPLWDCEQLILSPHVAGAGGDEGTKRTIDLVKENIARFQAKRPLLNPIAVYPRKEMHSS